MYADRVEASGKMSVKERLNGNSAGDSSSRRQVTGKRQRQDDKWVHDLFDDDDEPRNSNHRIDAQDLRLKLQKKSQAPQSGRGEGVRDLRDKLSGTMVPHLLNSDPPKSKQGASKPARRNVAVEAPEPQLKKVANTKRPQQKASSTSLQLRKLPENTSVDSFLQSLGLEKYLLTFQAEEVDMTVLVHMTDDDLKALGVPMGPRKKIILGLESRI
ncbi:SEC23-interacting protein [Linum grandiflorum]